MQILPWNQQLCIDTQFDTRQQRAIRSRKVVTPYSPGCPGGRAVPESSEPSDRVMVVAAHPDDPEFGCAGTVLKWSQAGKQITYVLLTSGDKGSHDPDLRPGSTGCPPRERTARRRR